jgi:pyruvate dehydrogenase E2 component (dihydrolipoamide acetyltransferase)
MAIEFAMPKLGLTMEQGTILEWLVPDGASVSAGTAVLLIETDKVETEVEAPSDGRLHQAGAVGASFECGARIGWFLADGEQAPASAAPAAAAPAAAAAVAAATVGPPTASPAAPSSVVRGEGGRLLVSPNARRVAASLGVDVAQVRGSGPGGRIVSEDVEAHAAAYPAGAAPAPALRSAPPPLAVSTGATPFATAAAVQLAQLVGLDLSTAGVATMSPDGRIGREDVAEHIRSLIARAQSATPAPMAQTPAATVAPALPSASQTPTRIVPMTGMRGTIASRMHASLREMAQLTLTVDADADALVADRTARKAAGGSAPSYTDYVIAAVARALVAHPMLNSQVVTEGIAVLPDVHIGMAVALEKGLVVPVIRNTLHRTMEDLATETARLAEAARAGKLGMADYEGGTFSVSTLGMYGVDAFTPVINPPNVAILGVGRIREDVAWDGDAPKRVRRMTLSLTWDHRVVDGAPAAEFASAVANLLREPDKLGA